MTKEEKFKEYRKHIGWEQVADIKNLDAECGERTTTKSLLAGLIENGANQTGIALTEAEEKELKAELKKEFC